jgi:hypothetical protein
VLADILLHIQGIVAGSLLVGAVLLMATFVSLRLLPSASTATRLCGIIVAALWILTAGFHALALAGTFRLWPSLLLAVPAGISALLGFRRRAALSQAATATVRGTLEGLRSLVRDYPLLASSLGGLAALRLLRGLGAPPLAWDLLTYHLVKAARWVQTGGLAPELAPDRWRGYEYFPANGDVLWAWAMLPFHGDSAVALASATTWLFAILAAFALARELGATRATGFLGAAALGMIPSCFNFLTSAYVENLSLFAVLSGALFAIRLLERRGLPREALLAVASLSLGAGVKASILPVLAVGLCAVLISLFRPGADRRSSFRWAGVSLLVTAVEVPPYMRAWMDTGSPLYPTPVVIAHRTLAAGDPLTTLVLAGKLYPGMDAFSWSRFAHDLLNRRPHADLLNPGWSGVLLIISGIVGAVALLRRPGRRVASLYLAISAAAATFPLFQPETIAMRTHWAGVIGRFLLPLLGTMMVFAASIDHPLTRLGFRAAIGLGWFYGIPRGFSFEDVVAASRIGGLLILCGAIGTAIALWIRSRRAIPAAFAASALLIGAAGAGWSWIRREARTPIYRAAWQRRSFDLHALVPVYASAFPIWSRLDGSEGKRVAATAGWNSVGDNWYRYPLFGSRLQNTVVYVPPSDDGTILDYRTAGETPGRFRVDAWIRRLVAENIDVVVLLAPRTIESQWVQALPSIFQRLAVSEDEGNQLYQVNSSSARDWLDSGAPFPPSGLVSPRPPPS